MAYIKHFLFLKNTVFFIVYAVFRDINVIFAV